jgi:hypothetical protein
VLRKSLFFWSLKLEAGLFKAGRFIGEKVLSLIEAALDE